MHNRPEALRIKEPIDSFRLDRDDYWKGVGNLALLNEEKFVSLRISRKCTAKMIDEIVTRMERAVEQGFVIISGFISPGERAVRDMLTKSSSAKFIRILPNRMPIDYKPESVYIDAFLENRYLEIAEGNEEVDFSRGACLELNDEIVKIARALPEHRDQPLVPSPTPEHRDQPLEPSLAPEHHNQPLEPSPTPEHHNQSLVLSPTPEHRDQSLVLSPTPEHCDQPSEPSPTPEHCERNCYALYFKVDERGKLKVEQL